MEDTNTVEMMDDDLIFDPADFADEADTGDHTEEAETEEVEHDEEIGSETIETSEPTTETTEPTETAEQQAETKPEPFVPVKFMGELKNLTIEEASVWAQKGMNYDRVVQQRDAAMQFKAENEDNIATLKQIAKDFGMESSAALLDTIRVNMLRQQGKTQAEAEAIVRADNANRQLQGYQTQEQLLKEQQEAARIKQQKDLDDFVRRYPNVDIRTLPMEVQDAVFGRGETLVNAYGRYEMQQLKAENQRLQQQINAQKQNTENKQKSLGSMRSGSQTPKLDDFLRGFNDD